MGKNVASKLNRIWSTRIERSLENTIRMGMSSPRQAWSEFTPQRAVPPKWNCGVASSSSREKIPLTVVGATSTADWLMNSSLPLEEAKLLICKASLGLPELGPTLER